MTDILQPPSTLLIGPSGSGKTTSLVTLPAAGIETFVIVTEPNGVDALLDAAEKAKIDMNLLHWATCYPSTAGWEALDQMTKDIGDKDFESISKIKGIGKSETRKAAERVLQTLKKFHCERTGKDYGDFTSLTDKQCLVIDSFSGLSTIAWYLTVGYKPTGAPGEWNIAQNWLSALLMKIQGDRRCYFVMTGHIEKELDEVTGVNKLMISTLGRKLAPKIPTFFSDVVRAQRVKTADSKNYTFKWSTIDNETDLKNKALPINDNLPPSFLPVVDAYSRRLKAMGASAATPIALPPAA